MTYLGPSARDQRALAIRVRAAKARKVEALVRVEATRWQVGPVEARLLILRTLIVGVRGIREALGATPIVLDLCQYSLCHDSSGSIL